MATTYPRVQVTVTPEVAEALARARTLWPGRPASQLMASLATAGAEALAEQGAARRAILWEHFGSLRAAYPPRYLDDLREDWS
ncbi:MAG: hypothetical protein LBI33_08340 [Propionibacteriaceae bacterium]|jgi:hypothetical protein|nr:hypothetical protein [Propionibacteriaceae bacterium]